MAQREVLGERDLTPHGPAQQEVQRLVLGPPRTSQSAISIAPNARRSVVTFSHSECSNAGTQRRSHSLRSSGSSPISRSPSRVISALRSPSAHSPMPVTPSSVSTSTIVFVTDAVDPSENRYGAWNGMFTGVARTAAIRMARTRRRRPGARSAHAGSLARMRITRVAAYRQLQPFRDGPYICRGQSEDGTDSTIVVLETDDGPRRRGGDGAARRVLRTRVRGRRRAPAWPSWPRCCSALDPREPRRVRRRSITPCSASRPSSPRSTWRSTTSPRRRRACRSAPTWAAASARASTSTARSRRTRPRTMARSAAAYVAAGYRRIQVKVGGDPAQDVERVHAVRAAVPADVVLFSDANGAWTTGQARAFLRATARPRDHARAAVHVLRRLPRRAPAVPAPARARRVHRLAAGAARGPARRRRRRRDDQDRARRRRRARGAAPRRGRRARHCPSRSRTPAAATSTPRRWRISRSRRPRSCASTRSTSTPGSRSATRPGMPPAADGRLRAPDGPGLGVEVQLEELGEPFARGGLAALSRPR